MQNLNLGFHLPQGELLSRPGVYLLTNLVNGKKYVGISANVRHRVKGHQLGRGDSKLARAIKKYGPENFSAEALCYTLGGTEDLINVEADQISVHDSIVKGYNVIARWSGAVGCRGSEYARIAKEAHRTPEYRAKMRAYLDDEEATIKRAAAIRAGHARNGFSERISEIQRRVQNDPEHKSRLRERLYDNPEYLEKLRSRHTPEWRANLSVKMTANYADPKFRAKQKAGAQRAGANAERNAKISLYRSEGMWITDGTASKLVPKGSEIPEGWRRGMTQKRRSAN